MYNLQSQQVSEYIMSDSRTFRAIMEFADGTKLENEIAKLSIDAQTAKKDIKAGDTISHGITAEITGLTSDLSGKTFVLYFYAVNLYSEIEKELIPFGRYKVVSCKQLGVRWRLEAYDGLYKSDGAYKSTLIYPTTTDHVELEICNKLGILPPRYNTSQLTDKDGEPILTADGEEIYVRNSAPVVINAPLEECTYREMLGYCAALDDGKCAMIDREGHLIHKGWTDIDYTISAGRADEPETDDKDITITQIVCQVSEGKNLTITANPGRAMTFSNPYMTQDIMGNIASRYFYKPYRPLSIYHRLGDPRLDMLDVVTVVKADGTSYRVPIMSMSYSYDGGLSAKIAATGTPDADNKSDNSSPMIRKVKKIVADSISATEEKLRASFEEMADYIVGNEGGYVVTKYNTDNQPIATYYTDNMDIEKAKEFLLINNHGIAGGTNGIHGPLNTAIDIQGRINATQILTGILSAIVIQSLNYDEANKTGSKINLEDGTFSFGGGSLTFGNNLLKLIGCAIDNGKFRVDSDGNVIMTSANITNGNINCGAGKFRVDSAGNVLANEANLSSVTITNGNFKVDKDGNVVMTSGMIKSSDGRYQIKAENAGFRIVDTVTGKTALIGNNPSNNTMGLECDWINVHNNISAPYINVNKYVSADDIMIAKTAGASTKTSLRDILKSGGLI
nr:MAG TPA: tail protein [Caudoviricetes sp.]